MDGCSERDGHAVDQQPPSRRVGGNPRRLRGEPTARRRGHPSDPRRRHLGTHRGTAHPPPTPDPPPPPRPVPPPHTRGPAPTGPPPAKKMGDSHGSVGRARPGPGFYFPLPGA